MAGTIAQSHAKFGKIGVVRFTCTADAADGSFPSTTLDEDFEGLLLAFETNPGSPAPTTNYDIAITDAEGCDVLGGVGANRHPTLTEKVAVIFADTSMYPPVDKTDVLTLAITGNAVNSAVIGIKLYYLKP